jgi:hypothetical protein
VHRPQIANLAYACGNTGNASTLRLLFTYNGFGGSGTASSVVVRLGGTGYANISMPVPGGPSTALSGNGASVSPASAAFITHVVMAVDIPCSSFTNVAATYTLLFTKSGTISQAIDRMSISACVSETCGNQGISCPGLKVTQACTPGVWVGHAATK